MAIVALAMLAAAEPVAPKMEVPARLLSGTITSADYPPGALRRGAEGQTMVRLVITAEGLASECKLQRSSGHKDLDAIVCPIVTGRMRFSPALDGAGKPMSMTAILPVSFAVEPR